MGNMSIFSAFNHKKITHIMCIVFFVVEKFAYLSDDVGDITEKKILIIKIESC